MAESNRYQQPHLYAIGNDNLQKGSSDSLQTGGPGGTFDGMDKERLARLEGGFDGLRSNQAVLMTAIAFVSAALLGIGSYTLIQINSVNAHLSTLDARVNDLPSKVGSELRDITKTLSEAITASKQTTPQVILLPAPELPAPPKTDQKPN